MTFICGQLHERYHSHQSLKLSQFSRGEWDYTWSALVVMGDWTWYGLIDELNRTNDKISKVESFFWGFTVHRYMKISKCSVLDLLSCFHLIKIMCHTYIYMQHSRHLPSDCSDWLRKQGFECALFVHQRRNGNEEWSILSKSRCFHCRRSCFSGDHCLKSTRLIVPAPCG